MRAALEEFAECGLASTEGDNWRAAGSGFVFEIPEDPEGQAAGRRLANAALLYHVDRPQEWLEDDEPRLALEWLRARGTFKVAFPESCGSVTVTATGLQGSRAAFNFSQIAC